MRRLGLPVLPAWLRWIGVAVVAVAIFYLSVFATPPAEPIVPGRPEILPLDKWRHFLAYAAFAGSLAYATVDWDLPLRYLLVLVVGVAVAYGLGVEFAQSLVPYRYFSVEDAYANALGALLVTPWYAVRPYVRLVAVPGG